VTSESKHAVAADGTLRLVATIAANGADFLVIESMVDSAAGQQR